jgi:hypothetical protein
MREIGTQGPLKDMVEKELDPGVAKVSDAQLESRIRDSAIAAWHPVVSRSSFFFFFFFFVACIHHSLSLLPKTKGHL